MERKGVDKDVEKMNLDGGKKDIYFTTEGKGTNTSLVRSFLAILNISCLAF